MTATTTTLVERIAKRDRTKHAEAVKRYRELLRSNNPKDADALANAMTILRKSADDVEVDLDVIERATQLEKYATRVSELERAYDKAMEELNQALERESQRVMEVQQKINALDETKSMAEWAWQKAAKACSEFKKLRVSHPNLWPS